MSVWKLRSGEPYVLSKREGVAPAKPEVARAIEKSSCRVREHAIARRLPGECSPGSIR